MLCGLLHCSHLSEKLAFGLDNVAVKSKTFLDRGKKVLPCRSALIDLGPDQPDAGLVPSGAKCGDGKVCIDRKCVPIGRDREHIHSVNSEFIETVQTPCKDKCSNNGICNSNGHCHCIPGWSGPTCRDVGVGGSVDSGPASADSSRHLGLFIWGLLGLIALILILGIIRHFFTRKKRDAEEDYRILLERSEGDQWQAKASPQLPLPRAFQL